MVFGRKSKMAIMQQQQQLAALQAQVRSMQTSHGNMPMMAPTEVHHHTREIINNVPQYIPVPVPTAEAATFMAPQMPAMMPPAPALMNQFPEPPLPVTPLAEPVYQEWGPMTPMTPVTPMSQVATPLEFTPQGPYEYISHTQMPDGTWEHNRWWE